MAVITENDLDLAEAFAGPPGLTWMWLLNFFRCDQSFRVRP